MKIQLQLIFICLLFCCSLIGQSTELIEQPDRSTWTTLKKDAYEIGHPAQWEVNESGLMNTSFILLSPVEDETDIFRENVNLMLQDKNGVGLTLDEYIELSLEQISNFITDSNILLNETVDKNNRTYQKIIYTGKQGIYDLKFEQYIWFQNENIYILTLTCEVDVFDQYKTVGEKILDSFTVFE